MHYELNENGYIDKLFFGCTSGECIEYTGTVPDGYTDLEDWAENSTVEAYKIIDGNLVYDPVRCAELEETYDKETAVNTHATIGYVDNSIRNAISAANINEMLPTKSASGMIIEIEDANNSTIPYISMKKNSLGSITGSFNLYVQGKNIMPITAIESEIEGISYEFNADKSITLGGTATADSEIDLSGNSTSLDVLFILKKNISYHLNCGYLITLYSYDGENRTQIYQATDGVITLSDDAKITQVTMKIASGTTVPEGTLVYPQIELGTSFTTYDKPKETLVIPIDLGGRTIEKRLAYPSLNLFPSPNLFPYIVDTIVIEDSEMKLNKKLDKAYSLDLDLMPATNYNTNTIYTDDDVYLDITYTKNSYYDFISCVNQLYLPNTFDSLGAINKLEIDGFTTAASLLKIVCSSDGITEDNVIEIDLYETPDEILKVTYENGVVTVTEKITVTDEQNVSSQEIIDATYDDIYLNTFDNCTYIYIKDMSNLNYSCNYMLNSTFTNYFCTRDEKNASIKVLEDSINLEVSQKVGFNEIIAALNLGIEEGQGIVRITGNQVIIDSDYFKLYGDGRFNAAAGTIGKWNLSSDGVLYGNAHIDNKTYQSGLDTRDNDFLLYSGCDITDGGSHNIRESNAYITKSGMMYAKWFEVNGESGHFHIKYNDDKTAVRIGITGIDWQLDDENNDMLCRIGAGSLMWNFLMYDVPCYAITDAVHDLSILQIWKYDPNCQYTQNNGAYAKFTCRIYCSGYRMDGVNNAIYVQGYEVLTTASDERLKENIKDSISNALDTVNEINIRQFDWRKDKHLKQGGQHIENGFIAQEVQKIDNTLVEYDKEFDTYQMNVLNISALEMKAIQELSQENKELKTRVSDLEEKLASIEKLLNEKGIK